MDVLVTGATGELGRALVERLRAAGHGVRVMSRRPGPDRVVADLSTGSGINAAARGCDVVVHAASDPLGDPQTVDVDGTGRLVRACREEGVGHLIYVSIIGVDRNPFAYFRAKLAAERIVARSQVPYSIVRASQFPTLCMALLERMTHGPICLAPSGFTVEPVAAEDLAARLVERIEDGPSSATEEFAGPERIGSRRLASTWLRARGKRALVLPVPMPGAVARAFRAKSNIASPDARRGTTTWAEWLSDNVMP